MDTPHTARLFNLDLVPQHCSFRTILGIERPQFNQDFENTGAIRGSGYIQAPTQCRGDYLPSAGLNASSRH